MNRLLTVAAVLSLPIAVTACNSSSTPSSLKSPSANPTSAAPTPSTSPVTGNDTQRVAAIQLTAADLPSGWKSQKISATAKEQEAEDAYFDGCLGVPTIEKVQAATGHVEFGRSDGFAFADSLINVTTDETLAQQYQAALAGAKTPDCVEADAKKFFKAPKDTRIVSIVASKLTAPAPAFGYRVVITLHLETKDRDVTITIDTYGVVVKRFIVQVTFEGVIQPPQTSLEDSVTAKVFARAIANAT